MQRHGSLPALPTAVCGTCLASLGHIVIRVQIVDSEQACMQDFNLSNDMTSYNNGTCTLCTHFQNVAWLAQRTSFYNR